MVYPIVFEVVMRSASGDNGGRAGVFLTGVQPRRERYKRAVAVVMEALPSISLREVLNKRLLVTQPSHSLPAITSTPGSGTAATQYSALQPGGIGAGAATGSGTISGAAGAAHAVAMPMAGGMCERDSEDEGVGCTSGSCLASSGNQLPITVPHDYTPNMTLLRNILLQVRASIALAHVCMVAVYAVTALAFRF